ncbi:Protein N-acetyltransferase, RimJ/RimL family [Micromonospora avicenniae]|uniref:Protein N-acetyltransferase, RimJ/RimL family n=2 Tax=Micromonospora avicenniae TaxID=1198245 RepID=A0A1N7DDA1_9ACTN|nr:Protein N-acetyltransferase, RimJ/RimL family [Micromonospora avicenniae]
MCARVAGAPKSAGLADHWQMFPVETSGRRLTLRELTEADAEALHVILADARVADQVLDEAPPSPSEIRDAIPTWQADATSEQRRLYKLAAIADGQLVGLGTLAVVDAQHRRGEIGYLIHPDRWGQGLATELAALLVELGFRTAELHRIQATTRPDNPASRRVLEKIGMRSEGRFREHLFVRGVWWDSLCYAILATDQPKGTK